MALRSSVASGWGAAASGDPTADFLATHCKFAIAPSSLVSEMANNLEGMYVKGDSRPSIAPKFLRNLNPQISTRATGCCGLSNLHFPNSPPLHPGCWSRSNLWPELGSTEDRASQLTPIPDHAHRYRESCCDTLHTGIVQLPLATHSYWTLRQS
jgi:hypothetical protein